MIETYMDQLEAQAKAAGVTVAEAAKAEGVHFTTVWRWKKRDSTISEETAKRISKRIKKMAKHPPNGS